MGGRLSAWTLERASASGLDGIEHGSLVEIDEAGPALVTALLADRVELAPLSPRAPRLGAGVRALGPLATPAGEDLIGRTVDCIGRALDGGPAVARDHVEPIFGRDAVVFEPGARRLTLGALVYDLQRRIGTGSSMLAVGPREVLRHVLRHQVASGRVVVIATPAATTTAHLDALRGVQRSELAHGPSEDPVRCIHVAAPLDATPALQWLVPWAAMAIASNLRARGRDAVVAIDHLDAWKPYVRAFAARGAWATQLAQLASRAYSRPSGSVSLIAMTSKLSATRASASDEVLDLWIATRGEIPFTGTKLISDPLHAHSRKQLSRACQLAWQLATFEQYGRPYERLDGARRLEIEEALRLRECLRFRRGGTFDSLEQELCLLAVAALPAVPLRAVADFIDAYLARLRRDHAATLAVIRASGRLNADEEHALLEIAAEVAISFAAPATPKSG